MLFNLCQSSRQPGVACVLFAKYGRLTMLYVSCKARAAEIFLHLKSSPSHGLRGTGFTEC